VTQTHEIRYYGASLGAGVPILGGEAEGKGGGGRSTAGPKSGRGLTPRPAPTTATANVKNGGGLRALRGGKSKMATPEGISVRNLRR
jgi:hypothetical protein